MFTGDVTNMLVLALALRICESNPAPPLPEIICLKRPDGHLVIMEGHPRATAIVLEGHRFAHGVQIYIGGSPSVSNWAYL